MEMNFVCASTSRSRAQLRAFALREAATAGVLQLPAVAIIETVKPGRVRTAPGREGDLQEMYLSRKTFGLQTPTTPVEMNQNRDVFRISDEKPPM